MSNNKLSRKDFLKLGGSIGAVLALGPIMSRFKDITPAAKAENHSVAQHISGPSHPESTLCWWHMSARFRTLPE